METGTFDLLAPQVVIAAVEDACGCELDGTLTAYPSYVNRVYGLREVDGEEFIVKFYRPGRWSAEAIADEHAFVADCDRSEVPVVAPLASEEGDSIGSVVAEADGEGGSEEQEFFFALYPKRGGRNFDAESDEDWIRLGSVAGRIHGAATAGVAEHRLVCTPAGSTLGFLAELREDDVVHPEVAEEFFCAGEVSQSRMSKFVGYFHLLVRC